MNTNKKKAIILFFFLIIAICLITITTKASLGDATIVTEKYKYDSFSNIPSPIHVYDDLWAIVYKGEGAGDDGFIETCKIGKINATLYKANISELEYNGNNSNTPAIVIHSQNETETVLVIATGWAATIGEVFTIKINHNTGIIQNHSSMLYNTTTGGYYNRIRKVTDNIYAIFYSTQAGDINGVSTLYVDDDGMINHTQSIISYFHHGDGHKRDVAYVGSSGAETYWAISFHDSANAAPPGGNAQVDVIKIWSNNGTIQQSLVSSKDMATEGYWTTITHIANDIFVIASDESANIITFKIGQSNGTIYGTNLDTKEYPNTGDNNNKPYMRTIVQGYVGLVSNHNFTIFHVDASGIITFVSNYSFQPGIGGPSQMAINSDTPSTFMFAARTGNGFIWTAHFDMGEIITHSAEGPTTTAVGVGLNPQLNITMNTTHPQYVNISFRTNASGNWANIGFNATALNGTYTQDTADMNTVSTKYWWSVNTTDGWGNWQNDTYTFTTEKNNTAPTITVINPVNKSTGVDVAVGHINVTIEDPEGDGFNYNWGCSDGSHNSAIGNTNGTKYFEIGSGADLDYLTNYTWWCNVTDGTHWTNQSFWFWTEADLGNPINSVPGPANNSYDIIEGAIQLNITVNDTQGNTVNVTISTNSTGSWLQLANHTGVNATYTANETNMTTMGQTYWWNVSTNDGMGGWDNDTYHLTIRNNSAPTITIAHPTNGSEGIELNPVSNISINDMENDNVNFSVWSNDTGVWVRGILLDGWSTNNTIDGLVIPAPDFVTKYWWSVNVSDGTNPWVNSTYYFTTRGNTWPTVVDVDPANKTVNWSVDNTTLYFNLTDANGDLMNYTVEMAGDSDSGSYWSNGTQSYNTGSLSVSTNYTWYVNVTDGFGLTNYTYWFVTSATPAEEGDDGGGGGGGTPYIPPVTNETEQNVQESGIGGKEIVLITILISGTVIFLILFFKRNKKYFDRWKK